MPCPTRCHLSGPPSLSFRPAETGGSTFSFTPAEELTLPVPAVTLHTQTDQGALLPCSLFVGSLLLRGQCGPEEQNIQSRNLTRHSFLIVRSFFHHQSCK